MSSRLLALALTLATCTPHAAPEPEPTPAPTPPPPVREELHDVRPEPPEQVRGPVLPPSPPLGWGTPPTATQLPTGPARALWTRPVSPAAGMVALVADEGGLAGVTWDSRVVSVAPATGALRWRDAEPGTEDSIDRPYVTLVGDVVVVAWPVERRVEGRGAQRGEVRWSHPQRAPVQALTRCAGHRVIAFVTRERSDDGAHSVVVALDPETGGQVWRRQAPGQLLGEAEGAVWFGPEFIPGGPWGDTPTRRVVGLDCADGDVVAAWTPPEPFVELHNGDAGRVLFSALARPVAPRTLCAVPARGDVDVAGAQVCVEEHMVLTGGQSLHGAALWGPRIYVASGHALARNLDPTPDAALVAFDLLRREVVGRSGADVASGDPIRAGLLWWSGFGSTGAKDQAHFVDPALVTPVRTVLTGKSPKVLAADRERAYAGTYDGRLIAVEIPAEARDPAPPIPPQVHASSPMVADAGAPQPRWRVDVTPATKTLTAITAIPARASASGLLLVAGGDRSLQLRRLDDGARLSAVAGLTKPIESLQPCPDGGAMALTSLGEPLRVSWDEDGRRLRVTPARVTRGKSWPWLTQVSEDCRRVVFSEGGGPVDVYSLTSGALEANLRRVEGIDERGLRTTGAYLPASANTGTGMALYDLLGETIAPVEAPALARVNAPVRLGNDDARLIQVLVIGKERLLTEHCCAAACQLGLWEASGALTSTIVIDTTGAGWATSVPSTLALTERGGELWIAWFRRDLDPMVFRASDGARMILDVPSALSLPAFAPLGDALTVAWTGAPRDHQLSLFTVEAR